MVKKRAVGETGEARPRRIKKSKKFKPAVEEAAAPPGPGYAVGQVAGSLRGAANENSPGPLASLFSSGAASLFTPIYVPAPPAPRREPKSATTPHSRPAADVRAPAPKKPKVLPASELLVSAREGPLEEADLQEEQREQQIRQKRKERRLQRVGAPEDEVEGPTRPQRPKNKAEERIKDKRTVFVGNLPVSFTKQALRALFKDFGAIESVRFRSVARAEPTLNRKVAAIQRQVHPKRKSIHAYVVYKEEAAAGLALARNGAQVEGGFNIRVDRASGGHSHDNRRSAFVGNLPYDVEDQVLRDHFAECGEVAAVRIIRDRETGVGKGFGYVLFEEADGAQLALKLDGSVLMGRKVRVKRCVQKDGAPRTGPQNFTGAKHKFDSSTKDVKKRPGAKHKFDSSAKDVKKRPGAKHKFDSSAKDVKKRPGFKHSKKVGSSKSKTVGHQRVSKTKS
ncbi:RNA-binding protein 34-like [Lissotriton helveticus]